MHLLAYGGRNDNLFVGAMSESLFFPAQPYVNELEYQFDRLTQQVSCLSVEPEEQLACLRNQDVISLQAANHAQHFPGHEGPLLPIFYWTPCVDGDFLQDLPYRLMRRGQFLNVPILFGTNTDGICSHVIYPTVQNSALSSSLSTISLIPPSQNRRLSIRPQLPHPLRLHQLLHNQLPPPHPLRRRQHHLPLPTAPSPSKPQPLVSNHQPRLRRSHFHLSLQ